jgi:hypothetical protein
MATFMAANSHAPGEMAAGASILVVDFKPWMKRQPQ